MQKKILILDDDKDTLEVLSIIFIEEYTVRTADKSADFMNYLHEFKPDLVIIDYLLRESITGKDLCFEMRRNSATSQIPIIVLSVLNHVTVHQEVSNCSFIPKPFDLNELTAEVKNRLQQ